MLARPAPAAPAAGALAWLDAGEALVDIRNEPETAHFAIGDDVDAGIGLLLDDLGDGTFEAAGIASGVKFNWRVNHGVTHSVYINDPNGYGVEFLYEMPREMWENDIEAGINWLENLPSEGPEALVDRTDTPSFGKAEPAAAPAE